MLSAGSRRRCRAAVAGAAVRQPALYGERHPQAFAARWPHVYALSLAVHCTSWTFYGTVTQAARYGWPLPPTFVGAILLYALAAALMVRLVRLARETNATSIADLIATRLGKDTWLAATVTLVAALGLVPYIALQLKAMAMSFAMLTDAARSGSGLQPMASPRRRGATSRCTSRWRWRCSRCCSARAASAPPNTTAAWCWRWRSSRCSSWARCWRWACSSGGDWAICRRRRPCPRRAPSGGGFVPLVLLGAFAMFILPHQFHIAVVECRDERDVRTARWLFPLYLVLIALPVLPLARAGQALLGGSGVSVRPVRAGAAAVAGPRRAGAVRLPRRTQCGHRHGGGEHADAEPDDRQPLARARAAAVVAGRAAWSRDDGGDLRGAVLLLRRAGIVAIMLLAWMYGRVVAGSAALADVGAVSFSALATLAPALAFAVWRPQTPPRAAIAGIVAAFAVWAWCLLLPMLATVAWRRAGLDQPTARSARSGSRPMRCSA